MIRITTDKDSSGVYCTYMRGPDWSARIYGHPINVQGRGARMKLREVAPTTLLACEWPAHHTPGYGSLHFDGNRIWHDPEGVWAEDRNGTLHGPFETEGEAEDALNPEA